VEPNPDPDGEGDGQQVVRPDPVVSSTVGTGSILGLGCVVVVVLLWLWPSRSDDSLAAFNRSGEDRQVIEDLARVADSRALRRGRGRHTATLMA